MIEWLQPFTSYLHTHPWVAIFFAGFVAFLESLAIIGTVIPGSVTLTAIGVMMGSGIIPVYPTIAAAIVGAVLGDVVSYFLGRYYHGNIRQMWPFTSYPNLLTQGETYFRQHGGKSIFFGRFVGPIRAILPLIAGMLDMPFGYFILSDIFSAFFWAPAYLLPGMLVGAATLELPPQVAAHIVMYLLVGLVVASISVWLLRRLTGWVLYRIDRLLAGFWLFCRRHQTLKSIPQWLHHDVARGHRQLAFLLAIVMSALVYLIILTQPQWLGLHNGLNRAIFSVLQSCRSDHLDQIILVLTYLGEKNVVYFTLLCTVLFLLWQKCYRVAIFIALNGFLSTVIIGASKTLIYSPRPMGFVSVQASHSFPSGHAGLFTANMFFISWILGRKASRPTQKRLGLVVVSTALLIGATRLYLGDHWFIDVFGGFAAGVFSASLCALVFSFQPAPPIPLRKTLLTLFTALFLGALGHAVMNWHEDRIGRKFHFPETHLSSSAWWTQTTPQLDRYREDRLGNPSDYLNVQWLAEKNQIQQTLLQKGWKQTPAVNLFEIIKRLFAKDKTQVLPVLPALLYYREPDILLVKESKDQPLLILRLWQTPYPLSDEKQPLWIGSLEYHIIWRQHWLRKHQILLDNLPDPLKILSDDTTSIQQKIVKFAASNQITHTTNPGAPQIILLLRS